MSENDLIGAWRLVSCLNIDESGNTSEGPLGARPRGLLIYSANGYMSVSIMRSDQNIKFWNSPRESSSSASENPQMNYIGYSGKWRLENGAAIVHEVEVSAHPQMVDTEQFREMTLYKNQLTLYGDAVISERPLRRVLNWQRA